MKYRIVNTTIIDPNDMHDDVDMKSIVTQNISPWLTVNDKYVYPFIKIHKTIDGYFLIERPVGYVEFEAKSIIFPKIIPVDPEDQYIVERYI